MAKQQVFRTDNTEGYSEKELEILNSVYQEKLDEYLLDNKETIVEELEQTWYEEIRKLSDDILEQSEKYLSPQEKTALVVPFGSGAHIILPKNLMGKTIRYHIEE